MKKLKPYLYTSLAVLLILLVVFIKKGIFPFGDNSLIWGDMHDQITAFYYHLYDCVYSNNSIFVNFSTSGGINFLGILAYYILSPFSLLVLIVPRGNIYQMVSIIITFKIIACSITCLYFLRTYFKKIPNLLSVLLAIIYAFSSYGLIMYQITPWIDAMYMFPLIIIGLKKVLDLEKPHFYIITLTLSLIFSFYVTIISLIFIFLVSFIYLYVYKEKNDRKKAISLLGITTILAIGISLFIVLPSYLEIAKSSRIGFKLKVLLNSKTGPLTDKLSMLTFGGIIYAGLILLIRDHKTHKKFLTFYIPTLLIMLIPLIVEPVNKVWHFGSYASFPYRVGYILIFLLIVGAAYAFNNYQEKETNDLNINKYASIFTSIAGSIFILKITMFNYQRFQSAIYRLSLSFDNRLILVLISTTLIAIISCIIILLINKKLNTFTLVLLTALSVVHITTNSFIYLGNDYHQEELTKQYKLLNKISKDYDKDEYYYYKSNLSNMIMNNGMVMKHHNYDHFTSLTNKDNLYAMKKLGYGSQWVKMYSRGGTLFTDSILGNNYVLTDQAFKNPYYKYVKNYDDYKLYKFKNKQLFGFLINKNDTIYDKNNAFEISNSLYHNITNSNEDIFTINDKISLTNVKATKLDNGLINYEIIDPDFYAYIEKDVIVSDESNVYFEIVHALANDQNFRINEAFDLYINNKLVMKDAFIEPYNGVMDLGIYKNEHINIKLELKKSVILKEATVGVMNLEKYNNFINDYYIDTNIKFNKNKITLKVNSEEEKLLFLPISYDSGYTAKINNKDTKIVKLYDNFIGIKLNKGENNITINYMPEGLNKTLIVSLIALLITVLLLITKFYNKIINNNIINTGIYYLYLFIYIAFIFIFYLILTLCFLLSYIKFINI